jgi:hypothetical protein
MWYVVLTFKDVIFRSDFLRSFMQFQHHNITSDKWSDQHNEIFLSREANRRKQETVENWWRCDIAIRSLWFHNTASEHVFIPEINPHCILSQIYALFIEFDYALFLFLFFKDLDYNTMIRTFCILKKMTFSAFHYLTLSVRCEALHAHIN